MNGGIPKWARERADAMACKYGHADMPCGALDAFAAYIAAHEEPPTDPLLGVVEEAVAGTAEKGAIQLREALARRGLKIVEADNADH